MSRKAFIILCATAGVMVALAYVASWHQPHMQATDRVGEPLLPQVVGAASRLKSVVIQGGTETVSLDWDGKAWRYRERDGYRADGAKITALLVQLAQLVKVEPMTHLKGRYGRLGLEDPGAPNGVSRGIVLTDMTGMEVSHVVVGRRKYDLSDTEPGVYVRISGDPQCWLARGALTLGNTPADWIDSNIVDIKDDDVQRVDVINPQGRKISLVRSNAQEEAFQVEDMPKGQKPPPAFVTAEFGHVLSDFHPIDVAKAEDKVLPYGVTIKARFELFSGLAVMMEVAPEGREAWVKLKASDTAAVSQKGSSAEWAKVADAIDAKVEGWAFLVPLAQVGVVVRAFDDSAARRQAN